MGKGFDVIVSILVLIIFGLFLMGLLLDWLGLFVRGF